MPLRLEWVVHDSSTAAAHLVTVPLEAVDGLQLGNSVTNIVFMNIYCRYKAVQTRHENAAVPQSGEAKPAVRT